MHNKITIENDDSEKDIQQFQPEIEAWKKLLNTFTEENVLLKNTISDILKNNFDPRSLEEIEEFQTRFIVQDEVIHSLKSDINDLDNFLYTKISEDKKRQKLIHLKIKDLRRDIINFTTRFQTLKFAFNDFHYKTSKRH